MEKPVSELEKFSRKVSFNMDKIGAYVGQMYHYTSAQGFESILFSDKNKTILWASRHDCLNDVTEGKEAIKIYKETCEYMFESGEITEELYQLFVAIVPAKTTLLPYKCNEIQRLTRRECDRYVCSFSKNKDSLAMWNYYSKGSMYEGFNIGFDKLAINNSTNYLLNRGVKIQVKEIIYNKENQKKIIVEFIRELASLYEKSAKPLIRSMVSEYLVELSLMYKSEFFEHEQEIRVIVDVPKKITFENVKIPFDVKYRNKSGFIIPYIELKLEKETVTDVFFGPLVGTKEQKDIQTEILDQRLNKAEYTVAYVDYSQIPVRF